MIQIYIRLHSGNPVASSVPPIPPQHYTKTNWKSVPGQITNDRHFNPTFNRINFQKFFRSFLSVDTGSLMTSTIRRTYPYTRSLSPANTDPPKSCITLDAFAITVADIGSALGRGFRKRNLQDEQGPRIAALSPPNAIEMICPLHALLPQLESHTISLFISNYLNPFSATGAGAGNERTGTKVSRESKLLVKELDSRNMERTAIPQEAPTDHWRLDNTSRRSLVGLYTFSFSFGQDTCSLVEIEWI